MSIWPEKCSEPCLVTGCIWLRAIYELLRGKKNKKQNALTPGKIALKSQGLASNFDSFMAKTELPQSVINRHWSQGISAGTERFFNDTKAYTEVTGVNRYQLCSQWCHMGEEARALWILAYKNYIHIVTYLQAAYHWSLFFFYRVVTSNITNGNNLISFFFLSSFARVPKNPRPIFPIKLASDYR